MRGKDFTYTKYLTIIFIFIYSVSISFAQANSSYVITHDKVTIVTNPKQGTNNFKEWGLFPAENKRLEESQ